MISIFGYSLKSIPVPNQYEFIIKLVEKIGEVIKKMGWNVFFSNKEDTNKIRENFNTKKMSTSVKRTVEI